MSNFTGQLNSNEIFTALFNAIISIQTFSDNVSFKNEIVDLAKEAGTLYGDTKIYLSTNVLHSDAWLNDEEAPNLLKIERPDDPDVQAITINKSRIIALSVDYYLSKRAFLDEGSFTQFTNIYLAWISETKRVYDYSKYNVFLGTTETTIGKQSLIWNDVSVTRPTNESEAHQDAYALAENLANLVDELTDLNRDYSDYQNLRKYEESNLKIVWNTKYLNRLRYVDLPSIFHKDFANTNLTKYKLNSKYFGIPNYGSKVGNGTTIRLSEETKFPDSEDPKKKDLFAGELLPVGKSSENTYTEDPSIICKILVKLPPFISGFEANTTFNNPRALVNTNYLIWLFNTLDYLKNYPLITIRAGKNRETIDTELPGLPGTPQNPHPTDPNPGTDGDYKPSETSLKSAKKVVK